MGLLGLPYKYILGLLMTARLNNFPTYVVYDRSHTQELSYVTDVQCNAPSNSGSPDEIIDNDLDTFYSTIWSNNLNTGGDTNAVIIDYGRVFWNCQVSYKAGFDFSTGTVNKITGYVQYSSDGVNYTTLETSASTQNAEVQVINSKIMINCQYIRFLAINGPAGIGNQRAIYIYECHLMGSD